MSTVDGFDNGNVTGHETGYDTFAYTRSKDNHDRAIHHYIDDIII